LDKHLKDAQQAKDLRPKDILSFTWNAYMQSRLQKKSAFAAVIFI